MALGRVRRYRSSMTGLEADQRGTRQEAAIKAADTERVPMPGGGSARRTLNGQMALESVVRLCVVEDLLEGGVFERCTIDVSRDPIVVEHRCTLRQPLATSDELLGRRLGATHNVVVVHVIRRTGDTRILPPRLPDQLEQIIHAGQDIVHEYDRVKDLVLVVAQLVEGDHRRVPDFCEVFDTVVELTPRAHGCADDHAQTDGSRECVKDPQEGLGLVVGPVLVDRDKDVVIAQNRRRSEKSREDIGNDVERVVQVDGEEVFVLLSLQVPLDPIRAGGGVGELFGTTPAK